MGGELRVSSIFPSYGSLRRCRPLLRRVPRTGSPTSSLLLRHSDFCAPPGRSASRSASRFRVLPAARRSPRFLGNPCMRAPFFDPGEELAGQRPRAFGPALNLRSVAFRVPSARRPSLGRSVSGLNSAARIPAVYASQPPSPAVHARLASGWRSPALAGQVFHLRVTLKVSHCYIVILFL
jgi:hypothetical protein